MRRLGPYLLMACAFGQETPPAPPSSPTPASRTYEYKGKPLRLPPDCKPDELLTLGLSCTTAEPCTALLELADIESIGNRLLVSGNLHTSSATIQSILLSSEDEGITWTEAAPRISGALLEEISFFDFEAGWISGHQLLVRPREPFFLVTSDGGKTWRKRPLSTDSGLGAITQFVFDSRTHGSAVVDKIRKGETNMRYEVYETMTGGDGWSLQRLTDTPVNLKTPPPSDKPFRLRADAKTNTYRVERHIATTWKPVASFAIDAGECRLESKEVEPLPPEEPPEPPAAAPAPKKPSETKRSPTLRKGKS